VSTPLGISRRDRSAHRVDAPQPARDQPSAAPAHLVRLTGDWALWRTVCLRGAGFGVHLLAALGDADLASAADALMRVRRRDGSFERGLLEVVGHLISSTAINCHDMMPPGPHTPRVTIDDLMVSRERWALPAAGPAFADTPDQAWLTDAQGHRYTAELRMVAVDQKTGAGHLRAQGA